MIWAPKKFLSVLPLLDVRHCCKLLLYTISKKTYDPNSKNSKKHHFGPDLGLLGPGLGHQDFLIKLVVRHCSKLSFFAI